MVVPALTKIEIARFKLKKLFLFRDLDSQAAPFVQDIEKLQKWERDSLPVFKENSWLAYYEKLKTDMLMREGIFKHCVIRFHNEVVLPQISKAKWEYARRRRPANCAALSDFVTTSLADGSPVQHRSSAQPTERFSAYAALNALVDGETSQFSATEGSFPIPEKVFGSNTVINLFDMQAISKIPMIDTAVGQIAIIEFFSSIVDFEFTTERKITFKKSDKKLLLVSKTLRNLAADCFQVPTPRASSTCDLGFNYAADISSSIADMLSFISSQSYAIAKNDPDHIAEEHEVQQTDLFESSWFQYLLRFQSIIKVSRTLYKPAKIWDDERTGRLGTKPVRPVGTHANPTCRTQFEQTPRIEDIASALDVHIANIDVVDFICSVERFTLCAKIAPLCNVGVLLAAKLLLERFASRQRAKMSRTMMPSPREKILLKDTTPERREERLNLERARKSALIQASNQHRANLNKLIHQLFLIYFNFALKSDPLRPSVHMQQLFRAGETEMPSAYVYMKIALYRKMLADQCPRLQHNTLIMSTAYSVFDPRSRPKPDDPDDSQDLRQQQQPTPPVTPQLAPQTTTVLLPSVDQILPPQNGQQDVALQSTAQMVHQSEYAQPYLQTAPTFFQSDQVQYATSVANCNGTTTTFLPAQNHGGGGGEVHFIQPFNGTAYPQDPHFPQAYNFAPTNVQYFTPSAPQPAVQPQFYSHGFYVGPTTQNPQFIQQPALQHFQQTTTTQIDLPPSEK
jgi:hypothetical protein